MAEEVIKIIPIPKHCRGCDCFGQHCKVTGSKIWYNKDGRANDCPVIACHAGLKNQTKELR